MSTQMTKYRPGDRVVVREDLMNGKRYFMYDDETVSDSAVPLMCKLAGQPVTIKEICSNGKYHIEDYGYFWTDEMFSGMEEEMEIFDVEDLI